MIARRIVGDAPAAGATTRRPRRRRRPSFLTGPASTPGGRRASGGNTDPPTDYCHPVPERWTQRRPPPPLPVLLCGSPRCSRGRRRQRAAAPPLERLRRSRYGLGHGAADPRERHFGERPDGVFTVVFRAPRPTAGSAGNGRRRGAASCRRAHVGSPRRRGDHLRRDRDDARPPAREGVHATTIRHALATRRVRQRAARDPARPRTYSLARPTPRRGDRVADRAHRPPRRARDLVRRARPVRVRGLHDRGDPRDRLRRSRTRARWSGYVTNLVELIGLGLAIDYSLLVVYRFREELRDEDVDGAIVRTMATAGRSVLFSGATVAIGLALLAPRAGAVRPLARDRRLSRPGRVGRGSGDTPAGTPSSSGARGMRRIEVLRAARDLDRGFWSRLAGVDHAAPVRSSRRGRRSSSRPRSPSSRSRVTPGLDRGAAAAMPVRARDRAPARPRRRRARSRRRDRHRQRRAGGARRAEYSARSAARERALPRPRGVHRRKRPAPAVRRRRAGDTRRVFVVGAPRVRRRAERSSSSTAFATCYVPRARFPAGVARLRRRRPAQGVDYLRARTRGSRGSSPPRSSLTYLVLLRAFRSLLLPLKAVS